MSAVEPSSIPVPCTRRAHGIGAATALAIALTAVGWMHLEYTERSRAAILVVLAVVTFAALALASWLGVVAAYRCPPTDALPFPSTPRRRVLLVGALAGLGSALLLPPRRLHSRPRVPLGQGIWRRGTRMTTSQGRFVRVEDVPPGSMLCVGPEGAMEDYLSLALIVRLSGEPGAQGAGALHAYSRLCTHGGCVVSAFRKADNCLVCPCHWSVFDAANGQALEGPATRGLPVLPIEVDREGWIVAAGRFQGPVEATIGACRGPHALLTGGGATVSRVKPYRFR